MNLTSESLRTSILELLGTFVVFDFLSHLCSHAELVCHCGKAIDEILLHKESSITYEEWIRYATYKLSAAVSQYPTVKKLIDSLHRTDGKMKAARDLLYRRFLPNEHFVELYDSKERRLASFLASEGALRHVNYGEYEVPFVLSPFFLDM